MAETLADRLGAIGPPGLDAARERAVAEVPPRIAAVREGGARRRSGLWARAALASAAVLAILLAAAVFTPPGRAVTSWVGDRIGLGQPGGHPSLQSLRHFAFEETQAHGQPAYVLVRGPGPNDGHYEFITYRQPRHPGAEVPANGARCYELETTDPAGLYGGECGPVPASGGMVFEGGGGNADPKVGFRFASGRVSADVASVEVTLDGGPLPVELRSIPAELIDGLRIRHPFKFFIAFFGIRRSGELTATARDADGRVLARRKLPAPAFPLGARPARREG